MTDELVEAQQIVVRFELPKLMRIVQRLTFPHKLGRCEKLARGLPPKQSVGCRRQLAFHGSRT